jgi:signal transduction histidine kinase
MLIDFRNNGVAFDVERLKKGVGLQSIHNRAYFYNGNLSVISKKNEGTSFHIELPLKNLLNHD